VTRASVHGAPEVIHAPAPWTLRGDAWVLLFRFREAALHDAHYLPPELRQRPLSGPSVIMFVDYTESPVGPYRELLYMPGRFDFGAGLRAWSVTRIFVSTWESVINGRINWGIPKHRADFRRERIGRRDTIRIAVDDRTVAAFEFVPLGPSLPVPAGLLPAAMRRLVQYLDGRRFELVLTARGRVGLARLCARHTDSTLFPDLTSARRLLAVRIPQFTLTFPVARIVTGVRP
jgi:hypothetical protein